MEMQKSTETWLWGDWAATYRHIGKDLLFV
jgi:hypothetical protein